MGDCDTCDGWISDELRGRRTDEKTERGTGVTLSRPGGSRDGGLLVRLGLCDIDIGGSGGGGGGDDGGLERFARLGASTRPVMMLSPKEPKECDCCMLCELLDWCGLPSQPIVASSGQSYSYNVGRAWIWRSMWLSRVFGRRP